MDIMSFVLRHLLARLTDDWSIWVLTKPMVITGFNHLLVVDSLWSIETIMVSSKIHVLNICYLILLNSLNRLIIVSILDNTGLN